MVAALTGLRRCPGKHCGNKAWMIAHNLKWKEGSTSAFLRYACHLSCNWRFAERLCMGNFHLIGTIVGWWNETCWNLWDISKESRLITRLKSSSRTRETAFEVSFTFPAEHRPGICKEKCGLWIASVLRSKNHISVYHDIVWTEKKISSVSISQSSNEILREQGSYLSVSWYRVNWKKINSVTIRQSSSLQMRFLSEYLLLRWLHAAWRAC